MRLHFFPEYDNQKCLNLLDAMTNQLQINTLTVKNSNWKSWTKCLLFKVPKYTTDHFWIEWKTFQKLSSWILSRYSHTTSHSIPLKNWQKGGNWAKKSASLVV